MYSLARHMSNPVNIERCGAELYQSMLDGKTVAPLTERFPHVSIEDAYQISRHYLLLRTADGKEQVVGKKIGVTSDAVQSLLGVYEPDFGFLTDAMQFSEGDVSIGHLIQPRAEAEIAFRIS